MSGTKEIQRNETELLLDKAGVDYSVFSEKESFCMSKSCKKKTGSKDFLIHVNETSKGTRYRLSCHCSDCGSPKSVFISYKDIIVKNSIQ